MSLRSKIVLLFLCLAVAPLLVVAGFGYWQASRLARDVVGIPIQASVVSAADEIEQSLADLYARMDRVGRSPVTRSMIAGDLSTESWQTAMSSTLGDMAYFEMGGTGGVPFVRLGARPALDLRCAGGDVESRWVTLKHEVTVGEARVLAEGSIWFDQLLSGAPPDGGGPLFVFDRDGTEAVFSSQCESVQTGLDSGLREAVQPDGPGSVLPRTRRIEFSDGEGRRQMAVVHVRDDLPWAVVATAGTDAILAPLNRLQASYWFFVLTMAAGTALAFSLLLGRVIRSLEELTAATVRIGDGELNPWLPPPGQDEVGRLSLAFSGMLERIRQMMQTVDQSGRLAVVGQLASYLAHEIRNPLSSIRMNLQGLQREVAQGRVPADCGEAIEISLKEVDRLSGSLTSVLQLGRPVSGERETVSVHDVVQDAVELLSGELKRAGVSVTMDLDATADRVTSVPGQLKGVFLNLIMNAVEAQPEGGRLEIRSRLVGTPTGGPLVTVHMRDHGRGIPPEVRGQIFEPFFTTKKKGSGIGLAVALRTIREHGGDLYLSELPETAPGSEFVVDLPLAALVAENTPAPSVHLPSWMDARGPEGGRSWPEASRREDEFRSVRSFDNAGIRDFITFSDSDNGEVH